MRVSTFRRRHQLFGLGDYSVVTWLNWLSFAVVVPGRFFCVAFSLVYKVIYRYFQHYT